MNRTIGIGAVLCIAMLTGCGPDVPAPGTAKYDEVVSAFYSGVAAMEVGEDNRAQAKLTYVTELAPREPAAWANLALMALRRGDPATAAAHLVEARRLDEASSPVLYLSGLMELREGRTAQGQAFLRQAITADSSNTRARYALWESVGEVSPEADALLAALLQAEPANLVLLLASLRAQIAQNMVTESLRTALETRTALLGPESIAQMDAAYAAAASGDTDGALMQLRFLHNLLLSEPTYRQDLRSLRAPIEIVADPLAALQRMETPQPVPAPKDDSLQFVTERFLADTARFPSWISAFALGNDALPAVFFADDVQLSTLRGESWPFPGAPGPHAVAGLDYNFDFRTDLALAGSEGFRLIAQDSTEAFADITGALGLPYEVTADAYTGVWAADIDLEGDVDIILAGRQVVTLRNNGDGTFLPMQFFGDLPAPKNFVWADLDSDGDPDAAWADHQGVLHLLSNERQGRFAHWETPAAIERVQDLAVTDSNSDGRVDLMVLDTSGTLVRLTYRYGWDLETLATEMHGFLRLLVADLDNNGAQDVLLSREGQSSAWLQDMDYTFHRAAADADMQAFAIASVWQAGRLDLIGLDAEGQPARAQVLAPRGYHWKQVKPRAAAAVGDQRINSFGIGGEVELRAGALYQKQPITQPILHFGLGDRLLADVARITWPNGSVQAEFDLQSDQVISAQQRLIGSCPWLFTHNGSEVQFVTDFIWRSPLGLRINAQQTAGVMTTEDWVKIRGDQLQAVDGFYDVRITGELWETHFFDHVSLMVVDHPVGTEIFLDERFAFPPPDFRVHVTQSLQPVASVVTDTGTEVSDRIRARDEQYLDHFGRGDYQGITRDHFIEIDLGDALPEASWLVASGWIRPTDSSINVAISQGSQDPPRPLRLEVLGSDGSWTTVYPNLGFPSGKAKTVLIDLEGIFAPDAPRRLRLHTNLEIYWDALHWAAKVSGDEAARTRVAPHTAMLRYRGFSLVTEADKSSPELPHYGTLKGTAPIWRDLIGYYTRFGDVGELLAEVDDRYVIMNAGDELALRFPEAPPIREGWRRDYVLIGDGWVKDGNLNTTAGKYVRPLPLHDQSGYAAEPGALVDDPVFRRHAWDWQEYHTRFVAPEEFSRSLRLR